MRKLLRSQRGAIPVGIAVLLLVTSLLGLAAGYKAVQTPTQTKSKAAGMSCDEFKNIYPNTDCPLTYGPCTEYGKWSYFCTINPCPGKPGYYAEIPSWCNGENWWKSNPYGECVQNKCPVPTANPNQPTPSPGQPTQPPPGGNCFWISAEFNKTQDNDFDAWVTFNAPSYGGQAHHIYLLRNGGYVAGPNEWHRETRSRSSPFTYQPGPYTGGRIPANTTVSFTGRDDDCGGAGNQSDITCNLNVAANGIPSVSGSPYCRLRGSSGSPAIPTATTAPAGPGGPSTPPANTPTTAPNPTATPKPTNTPSPTPTIPPGANCSYNELSCCPLGQQIIDCPDNTDQQCCESASNLICLENKCIVPTPTPDLRLGTVNFKVDISELNRPLPNNNSITITITNINTTQDKRLYTEDKRLYTEDDYQFLDLLPGEYKIYIAYYPQNILNKKTTNCREGISYLLPIEYCEVEVKPGKTTLGPVFNFTYIGPTLAPIPQTAASTALGQKQGILQNVGYAVTRLLPGMQSLQPQEVQVPPTSITGKVKVNNTAGIQIDSVIALLYKVKTDLSPLKADAAQGTYTFEDLENKDYIIKTWVRDSQGRWFQNRPCSATGDDFDCTVKPGQTKNLVVDIGPQGLRGAVLQTQQASQQAVGTISNAVYSIPIIGPFIQIFIISAF